MEPTENENRITKKKTGAYGFEIFVCSRLNILKIIIFIESN
jgi:hypothetical protein